MVTIIVGLWEVGSCSLKCYLRKTFVDESQDENDNLRRNIKKKHHRRKCTDFVTLMSELPKGR